MSCVNYINVCTDSSTCIFCPDKWKDPLRISGLVLLTVALLFVLIIILIKKLHVQSTGSTIFIIITVFLMIAAIGL
ncbi:unnamed protein product [Schistosoma turkestanicum]|nr:unnamed protein product [Schistosoma turkestanicum]